MIGEKFGRWLVIDKSYKKGHSVYYNVICDCGVKKTIRKTTLINGESKSCGCLSKEMAKKRETKHGESRTYIYHAWSAIKQRCFNKKNKQYHLYGGRGIGISKDWLIFEKFYKDIGERPTIQHSIDRIDNNKGYFKENCRWSTMRQQSRNKRNNFIYNGECATDACIRLGGSHSLINNRIKKGWSLEKAFTTPIKITLR